MGINLFRDLGFDEQSAEVRRAREEAAIYADSVAALFAARKSEGLSQAQVADRMGTTQSAVSEIEAGSKDMRLSTLIRYAQAVDRTIAVALSQRSGAAESIWEEVAEVRPVRETRSLTVKVRLDATLLAALDDSDRLFASNNRRYDFEKAA